MMDFIVKVSCCACDCDFELRGKSIENSEQLLCPNCHQAVPKSIFDNLKVGMIALSGVPSSIDVESKDESSSIFRSRLFMFEVLSHNPIEKGNYDKFMHQCD